MTYRYGDHGLPVSLESSVKGKIVSNATYNALGKLFDVTLGNGLTTSYRYWGPDYGGNAHYGLLRGISTGPAQSLTYNDYDAVGNIKQLVDGRTGETINFTYDHLDRLEHAWSSLFDESYSYNNIGNFGSTSKPGGSYTYPSAGSAHPHAPLTVASQGYTFDANGNLYEADERRYIYDVENRLVEVQVIPGYGQRRVLTYDADGVLRSSTNESGQKTLYATPDYQVNLATGEVSVYYRFGGRAVAWRSILGGSSTLRYLLEDHLSSSHAEVGENQAENGQRRYYPFGSDRAVSGAPNLTTDDRFTSQRRSDDGNGNARRELYHYGARWYLPGVGIFAQPDTIVPDYKNPQALNRYSYGYNNPVKYVDPTGHDPADWFNDDWLNEFREAHGGVDPTTADYTYRFITMLAASGAEGVANLVANIPEVEYGEGVASVGNPDTELTQTLSSTAEALDWASATVSVSTAVPAGILLLTGVGAPAAGIVFGIGQLFATGISVASLAATATADILTERTVPLRVSVSSISLGIETRVGMDTAISGGTILGGGIAKKLVKQIGANLVLNGAELAYDRARANGLRSYSHYRTLAVRW